jgi:hypothetical protein
VLPFVNMSTRIGDKVDMRDNPVLIDRVQSRLDASYTYGSANQAVGKVRDPVRVSMPVRQYAGASPSISLDPERTTLETYCISCNSRGVVP